MQYVYTLILTPCTTGQLLEDSPPPGKFPHGNPNPSPPSPFCRISTYTVCNYDTKHIDNFTHQKIWNRSRWEFFGAKNCQGESVLGVFQTGIVSGSCRGPGGGGHHPGMMSKFRTTEWSCSNFLSPQAGRHSPPHSLVGPGISVRL